VLETTITTFNLLSPATGAFNPNPAQALAETIQVLIATPKTGVTCTGALAGLSGPPLNINCSPMVIFRHGLGRGRADMLAIANTLAGSGLTTVAIDAEKHGDRSFCTSGVSDGCIPGAGTSGICATQLPPGAQADANPPGKCPNGFLYRGVSSACTASPSSCTFNPTVAGIPYVSGNYLVSANFFRTRDTLRQDIIDQSQLVRAIAFAPPASFAGGATGHTVFDHMVANGAVVIDPTKVYYVGQSLGAIQGAANVAANPRISKAVLNVGGGTVVDIFTNSPAFAANTNQLLAGLGILPGANTAYLQFLVVAKTILDPADPVNFAGHLQANTLPNLLPPLGGNPNGTVPQAAKSILAQMALCDQVVPNAFGFVLDSTAGTAPLPLVSASFGVPGNFELFYTASSPPSAGTFAADLTSCLKGTVTASAVSHGFLLDFADVNATAQAQADAASFLFNTTLPPSLQVVP
jgi:hypothetical protein